MKVIYMQRTIVLIASIDMKLADDIVKNATRIGEHKEQKYLVYEFDNKEL